MSWAQGILDGGRRLRLNRRDSRSPPSGVTSSQAPGGRLGKRYHHVLARTRRIARLYGFFTVIQSRKGRRPVGRAQPLRHDTLKPELAGISKNRGAICIGVLVEHDPRRPPRQRRHSSVSRTWIGRSGRLLDTDDALAAWVHAMPVWTKAASVEYRGLCSSE
jgi:hypothetical protein